MRTFDVQGIEIVAPGHKVFEFVTPSRGHTLEGPRRVGSLLADLAISF